MMLFVQDAMPLIEWNDGSKKYLYVDVHRIEIYQVREREKARERERERKLRKEFVG